MVREHHEVRRGDDSKVTQSYDYGEGRRTEVYSYVSGVYSTFLTGDHVSESGEAPTAIIGWESSPQPAGGFLTLRDVIGVPNPDEFPDALEKGVFSIEFTDTGGAILRHTNAPAGEGTLYFFDDERRLVSRTHGVVPPPKVLSDLGKESVDEIYFTPKYEIVYTDFVNLSGLDIPCRVTKIWYGPTDEGAAEASRIQESIRSGEVNVSTIAEVFEWQFSTQWEPFLKQTLELNLDDFELNPDLYDDDFRVEYPVGTVVIDRLVDRTFTVGTMPPWEIEELNLAGFLSETGSKGPTPLGSELAQTSAETGNSARVLRTVMVPEHKVGKGIAVIMLAALAAVALMYGFRSFSRSSE
ncbi:MAG TPA: hypothetical protein HPP83_01655 [Candidatus Hydrogenedentes bacterium]|nr:hypothetical protein [Candidatus Hydrogenedentota bacterium]